MKLKRYILLAALMLILICCFASTVSAAPLTVDVKLDGVTHSFTYIDGDIWGDFVGGEFYFGDDQATFEVIDGCMVLRVTDQGGTVFRYSLYILKEDWSVFPLVLPTDMVSDSEAYRFVPYGTGEITLKLDGVFEKHYFAGNADVWGDLCDSGLVGDGAAAFIVGDDSMDNNGNGDVLFVLDGVYGYYVRDDENQRIRNVFGFSPGVYNLELAFQPETTSTISVDFNGQTCVFQYDAEVDTFAELISSGTYSHPILGTCQWEVCDGYITLVMLDYEEPLFYRLVVSDEQLSWTLVPEGAELISDVPYSLSVELIVNVNGSPYSFKLPSCVKTWNDVLLLDGPYEHPELGWCRWFSDNDHVCMEVMDLDGVLSNYHIVTVDRTSVYLDYDFAAAQPGFASYVFLSGCFSHSYTEVHRLAATCEADGYVKYLCSVCDASYEEKLPQLHHLWNIEVIQEPTCETIGVSRLVCGSCGFALEPYEVAVLGHQAADATVVREPTCTEAGVYSTYCERCGYAWEYDVRQRNHEYDWKGTCQFCGYNKITGAIVDGWNKVEDTAKDFWDDLFGGSSSGSDEKPWYEDILDKIKGDGSGSGSSGNSFADGVRSLVSLLSLGLVCLVVVILWPILKPIMVFIGDGIKAAIKAASSGAKSLSKKVKNKKKS